MTLSDYLKTRRISPEDFGKKLGVIRWTVDRWCKGRVPPAKYLAKIQEETNGIVTPNDFFPFAPQKRTRVRA